MGGVRLFIKRSIATILGGFHVDSDRSTTVNALQFILWLFLLCLPLCISLITTSIVAAVIYAGIIFVVFYVFKILNYIFHKEFDGTSNLFYKSSEQSITNKVIAVPSSPVLPFGVSSSVGVLPYEIGGSPSSRSGNVIPFHHHEPLHHPPRSPLFSDDFDYSSPNTFAVYPQGTPRFQQSFHSQTLATSQTQMLPSNVGDMESDTDEVATITVPTSLHLRIFRRTIKFTRLNLISFFDKSQSLLDVILAPLFATGCALLGFFFLHYDSNNWFVYLVLWITIVAAQFSLLYSPKPDAASPRNEYAAIPPYTRAIYLILVAALIKIFDSLSKHSDLQKSYDIYGVDFTPSSFFHHLIHTLSIMVLWSPLFFLFGVLPQPDTLLIYVLEQINILIFGGSGISNTRSAIFDFLRSAASVAIVFAVGLSVHTKSGGTMAVYVGLMFSFSYFLSRLHSDPFIFFSALRKLLAKNSKVAPLPTASPNYNSQPNYNPEISRKSSKKNNQVSTPHRIQVSEIQPDPNDAKSELPPISESPKVDETKKRAIEWCARRLVLDVPITIFLFGIVAILHQTTVFGLFENKAYHYFWIYAVLGTSFVSGYLIPELRRPYPFKLFTVPFIGKVPPNKTESFPKHKFELFVLWCDLFLKYFLFPFLILSAVVTEWRELSPTFGHKVSVTMTTISGMALLRSTFGHPTKYLWPLLFTRLFFVYDLKHSETFVVDLYLMSLAVFKIKEMILKIQFSLVYLFPWSKSWGSVAHALLQPLGFPHMVFYVFQVMLSSLLSVPLYPFLGSALFFISYARPIKFWERGYVTDKVSEKSVASPALTRGPPPPTVPSSPSSPRRSTSRPRSIASPPSLSHAIAQQATVDLRLVPLPPQFYNFNHVDAIFYEHLLHTWQRTLARDISLGRFGVVSEGDIFVLMNDKLTSFMHIIELGNGYCTFQIRGLEFKGTYCQERELGAINRQTYLDHDENVFTELFGLEFFSFLMSFHDMVSFNWRTWEVVNKGLQTKTYSIALNPAHSMFGLYDFRRSHTKLYVQCLIFQLINSPQVELWLQHPELRMKLAKYDKQFIELDPHFVDYIDVDFDTDKVGITVGSFMSAYGKWINLCCEKLRKSPTLDLAYLCLSLSLYARIVVVPKELDDYDDTSKFLENLSELLCGKREFPTQYECEFLRPAFREIIFTSAKMSFILFLDSFTSPDEYENPKYIFKLIEKTVNRNTNKNESRTNSDNNISNNNKNNKNNNNTETNVNNNDNEIIGENSEKNSISLESTKSNLNAPETPRITPRDKREEDSEPEIEEEEFAVYKTAVADETSPMWREHILGNTPQLVALRKVMVEARQAGEDWLVLMLNLSDQNFKVVKINKESVRGLWAGQQQELVYFGSTNSERGSIQQQKNILRNLINQSCDFPVGYPIYVSPLTTSYTNTTEILGIRSFLSNIIKKITNKFKPIVHSKSSKVQTEKVS